MANFIANCLSIKLISMRNPKSMIFLVHCMIVLKVLGYFALNVWNLKIFINWIRFWNMFYEIAMHSKLDLTFLDKHGVLKLICRRLLRLRSTIYLVKLCTVHISRNSINSHSKMQKRRKKKKATPQAVISPKHINEWKWRKKIHKFRQEFASCKLQLTDFKTVIWLKLANKKIKTTFRFFKFQG